MEIPIDSVQGKPQPDSVRRGIDPATETAISPDHSTPQHSAAHRELQWAHHRPTIKRLYLDENKTLKEVMEIMENSHKFTATLKTYKARIRSWGYRKNVKLQHGLDDRIVTGLFSDNGHESGRSQNLVRLANGHSISVDRLASHLRRKGLAVSTDGRSGNKMRLSQAPLPSVIRPPDTFYISEAVLDQTRSWVLGRYEGRVTTPEAVDELRTGCPHRARWSRFAYAVRNAVDRQSFDEALFLMRRAPDEMTNLVRHQPADFTGEIFRFLTFATHRALPDSAGGKHFLTVVRALIRYAAASTTSDPAHRLFRFLTGVSEDVLYSLSRKAWWVNCQTWCRMLESPESLCNIAGWLDYADGGDGCILEMPPELGSMIDRAIRSREVKYGERDDRCTRVLFQKGVYLATMAKGRKLDWHLDQGAIAVLEDALKRGLSGNQRQVAGSFVADSYKKQGQRGLAEGYLHLVIDDVREESGERSPSLLRYYSKLAEWMTEWGETKKAEEATRLRDEILAANDTQD